MKIKTLRFPLAFIAFLVAHYQFKFVDNDIAFYIVAGVLGVGAMWPLVQLGIRWKLSRTTPEFNLEKLINKVPKVELGSADARLAGLSESLYMVTETTSNAPECYINSLEILDLDDQETKKVLGYSIESSWDISNRAEAVQQIEALITEADEEASLTLADVPDVLRTRFQRYLAKYGSTLQPQGNECMTAYNLIRASWLARATFSCGHLDEPTARAYVEQVGRLIPQHFASWNDLAVSYLFGFLHWSDFLNDSALGVMKEYSIRERICGAELLLCAQNSPFYGKSLR
ncbi:DUF1266 domain-containing protein [Achromobacter deleyi]|uniref:DUF1266 domain-containing protein n=1 Tax=Achromobacter deleyi TaxID=1353891 RepID=UPI001469250E|nr:DUF1266 domain-containing protein [Achromobacter deleyi]CAB3858466.1 hypothetical protein LMG3412_02128 [Achromobacter deleyi]